MKKLYLFLTGAVLASMPLMSQRPASGPDDPKLIFTQNFEPSSDELTAEQAWAEWQATPVDTIKELYYFAQTGSDNLNGKNIYDGSANWQLGVLRTDSTSVGHEPGSGIILFNGVVTTDDASDIKGGYYDKDVYSIRTDGDDIERAQAFEKYAENGGDYFFRYISDDATGAGSYSSGIVPNYRRNLFVRGLDIEDNSSYRLTFFVKARRLGNTAPTLYADVMRGYFHSEKPFSMDLGQNSSTFEYKKEKFTNNKWEKITFMTYYLNDSIADGFVYANGYWWGTDWTYTINDRDYNYIKQPDKFFVRLSFASDSTEFDVDNITLTKSWIGGVEHYYNMIRVDFGYETNLLDLAKAAYDKTNIAVVELPGQYFSVYGYYGKGKQTGWYPIEIESAEYHDDGYMYMWSKDTETNGKFYPNPFSNYDSVLVSFINPVDNSDICLKYTGSTYPCALDTAWVNAGKTVKNFSNEISKLNPNIATNQFGKKVYSLKELPPVITSYPYENGSFGLDAINEITVGMSKVIEYEENAQETSEKAFLRVTKAGFKEIWSVSNSTESSATFTRSQADINKNGALDGDYKFEFVNLKGIGTDYAQILSVNYGFGEFDTNPSVDVVFASNFKDQSSVTQSVPKGAAIWNGKDKFTVGNGGAMSTKSRLFWTNPESGFTSGMYISGRQEASDDGHFIYGVDQNNPITLAPGTYSISFSAAHWDKACETKLYMYPNTFGENLADIKDMEESAKTLIGTFTPQVTAPYKTIQIYDAPYGSWPAGVESFSFVFDVTAAGNYLFEWVVTKNSTNGTLLSDFAISTVGDLSFPYVTKLNAAVAKAQEKLESIDDDIYFGAQYDALSQAVDDYFYENWQDTKPSAYDAATAYVESQIKLMQERIDTVDAFNTQEDKVIAKLAEFDDDTLGYTSLVAFKALEALYDGNEDYAYSEKTNAEINADIKAYDDAIKALDTRMELNNNFTDKLAEIKSAIEDKDAHVEYAEYAEMVAGYNQSKDVDVITPTDDEFTSIYNDLCGVLNVYVFKVDGVEANSRQANELFALADSLGFVFDDDIKARVAALQTKDSQLESYLREAAILQILKIFASDDDDKKALLADNFDVSALIPNYFLANDALVDRDMVNNDGTWGIKSDDVNTTAIPGWSLQVTKGNWLPTSVKVGDGDGKMNWDVDGHAFIGGLRCSPHTAGVFTTEIENLPAGFYTVGFYGYNNTSNLTIAIESDSCNVSGSFESILGSKKWTSYKVMSTDSVKIAGTTKLNIKQTSDSDSEFDMKYFVLYLQGPQAGFDYAAALKSQETKVADMITFADAPVQQASVEFFNLSGIQIDAPKAGEIVIKRTILNDGNAVVEKVLAR